MLAVNRYGMRVSLTADARSGRILSVTPPYGDPAPGARKVTAQLPRAYSSTVKNANSGGGGCGMCGERGAQGGQD
jgi:hypothetical protein